MNILVLILFGVMLTGSVFLNVPLVLALTAGLILFIVYGVMTGHKLGTLLKRALDGVKTISGMLITFIIIGTLTALWRASGTVPAIVCYSSDLIRPEIFIMLAFVLNCILSTLTGTAFGTGATMGVICMSISTAFGIDPAMTGGAILAGAYFGDRCSPVSTSALLVSVVTDTDIYDNIRNMIKTAILPFILSCGIFLLMGFISRGGGAGIDVRGLFGQGFVITPIALIPAAAVLLLALFRVKIKMILFISDICAFLIAFLVQGESLGALIKYMLVGYKTKVDSLSALIDGGGASSMVMVSLIVCVAATYSGVFEETGLVEPLKDIINKIAKKTDAFVATLAASIIGVGVGCNQTMGIMLAGQLCTDLGNTKEELALDIEDSAAIIAPLIPWAIAGTVVLAMIGAPTLGLAFSCYLYVLPLCRLGGSVIKIRKRKRLKAKENTVRN